MTRFQILTAAGMIAAALVAAVVLAGVARHHSAVCEPPVTLLPHDLEPAARAVSVWAAGLVDGGTWQHPAPERLNILELAVASPDFTAGRIQYGVALGFVEAERAYLVTLERACKGGAWKVTQADRLQARPAPKG